MDWCCGPIEQIKENWWETETATLLSTISQAFRSGQVRL
jgi:hypothetical protein